jgi:hypothetical protein
VAGTRKNIKIFTCTHENNKLMRIPLSINIIRARRVLNYALQNESSPVLFGIAHMFQLLLTYARIACTAALPLALRVLLPTTLKTLGVLLSNTLTGAQML